MINGFPRGGQGLIVLNAELRIPVRGGLGAVAFIDGGNVPLFVKRIQHGGDPRLRGVRSAVPFAGGTDSHRPRDQARSATSAAGQRPRTADRIAHQPGAGILMELASRGQRAEGRGQNVRARAATARLPLLSALCPLRSALCPVSVRAEMIDRVLAILPGQIVTLSDVEAAIDLGLVEVPAGADRIAGGLSALIDRMLMLNEVRRVAPAEPSPAAIDARVTRIRQRLGAPADMARVLSARGLDETVRAAVCGRRSAARRVP